MKKEEIKRRIKEAGSLKWYHRYEVIKGSGVYTPGWVNVSPKGYKKRLSALKLSPAYFKGKRVLDIGTSTGAFAFYLEDLGADVVAMDICRPEEKGFSVVHEIRASKVKFRCAAVYDLNPEDFGYFDIVAFYGVHYHLKHPLLAFERINSICKDGSLLIGGGTTSEQWFHNEDESCNKGVNFSLVTKESIKNEKILNVNNLNELPLCGFSSVQFFRDKSNWFIPNSECIRKWIETAGFKVEVSLNVTAPLNREWNKDNIYWSGINFRASKVGLPVLENFNLREYKIPTSLELERANEEIKQLKEQLRKYEDAAE